MDIPYTLYYIFISRFMRVIAKSSQVIYSFGGEGAVNDIPTNRAFRYTRADDKWTEMPAMPVTLGGSSPNCAKVVFRSRDVVLCFGTTREAGDMYSFDLDTETWEELGIVAPTPPNYESVLFVVGHTLYR